MDTNPDPGRQIKCDVCQVWCSGTISYQNHIMGKPHYVALQKAKGVEFGPNGTSGGPPAKKARKSNGQPPEPMRCEICNTSMPGREAYEAHLKGVKHLKKIKENEIAPDVSSIPHIVEITGGGYRCSICEVDMSGKVVVLAHVKGSKHTKKLSSPAPPPPPDGAAPPASQKGNRFECSICHIFTNTLDVMKVHENSAKHKHKAERAAKLAAQEAAKQAALEDARLEGKVGLNYDAWDPQG